MAVDQRPLGAARPQPAGRCGSLRREPPRSAGKRGAAAAAPIKQRRGAVVVVGVHPAHHRLRMAPTTGGDLRRAPTLRNLVQREKPLASAGDEHAAPNCASPPLSDPSGSHRHVTPVLKKSRVAETPHMETHGSPPSQKTTGPKLDGV